MNSENPALKSVPLNKLKKQINGFLIYFIQFYMQVCLDIWGHYTEDLFGRSDRNYFTIAKLQTAFCLAMGMHQIVLNANSFRDHAVQGS